MSLTLDEDYCLLPYISKLKVTFMFRMHRLRNDVVDLLCILLIERILPDGRAVPYSLHLRKY